MAKLPELPGVSLSDFIKNTADELRIVRSTAPTKGDEVIELSECELEVAAAVKAEIGGGFKVWILSADAKGSAEATTKVRLKFKAVGGVIQAAVEGGGDVRPKRQSGE